MIISFFAITCMSQRKPTITYPEDIFPECKKIESADLRPKFVDLKKDQFACIEGSMMLAGKGQYETISAMPYEIKLFEIKYNKTNTVKNALAVLGDHVHFAKIISKVTCLSTDGCRIQFMEIDISFYQENQNIPNSSWKGTSGTINIVSTKNKDKFNLKQIIEVNKNKKKKTDLGSRIQIVSPLRKTLKYKRDKHVDLFYNTDSEYYNNTIYKFQTTLDKNEEIFIYTKFYYNEDIYVSSNVEIEWEPEANQSISENDSEWYFPEMTITVTAKEGIFTIENISQKYPLLYSSGLSIVFICCIVAAIIIVVIGISLTVYLIQKRKSYQNGINSNLIT
ncbi:hypothetical protein TVAG_281320 [Trichomonas vaginalis G3]|uniref:Uncharacterized protein n=1 Tax=Trichomonas vaginalis (strain ATCC PRA-98 / G3) TaxID=412133 RepID=A2F956_TRIV3|nr:hypothetical protein TVAGG3_0236490 [Trichomonas vaginalis G3]EAX98534.1 hypothetical protein TVAG_281320 [Trichomonas vaginalis G3]KAI5553031.1 hypothetical protein TVAGG3_0236490 [Trichomonas vaginalis G3]|eukprot:XP_001311464.1 hypothetical protein [Trichomonas vaginalis G3]